MEDHGFDALGGAPTDCWLCAEGSCGVQVQRRQYLYRNYSSNNVGAVSLFELYLKSLYSSVISRPVYAAINYLILSRVLYYVPYLSPIHPGRVLTTFLAADGVCETLIGNGASRMANANLPSNQRAVGENLVKAALIMQACLFMLFILLAIVFQRRASKSKVLKPNIQTVLIVMYISCTIITVRCIYRIVEFFLGYTGYIYTHEPFFWVFEASIMFANTAMLNIWHPGRYFPQSNKVFLSKDGQTELRGPGWSDDRPFIVTFFDPFDLYGLFTGRDSATKFWELSPEELAAMDAKAKEEKARKAERRHPMLAKAFKYTNTRSQEVVGSPFQKPSADNLEV